MADEIPELLQPVFNLAKAREILRIERDALMPEAGLADREETLATISRVVTSALAGQGERMPVTSHMPLDAVAQAAWSYLHDIRQMSAPRPLPAVSAYESLKRLFADRTNLEDASGVLSWLTETRTLKSIDEHLIEDAQAATQLFMLRCLTGPEAKKWLEEVRPGDLKTEADKRNFALMQKLWLENAGLDEALLHERTYAVYASKKSWAAARAKNDFSLWCVDLEKVVELTRRKAAILAKAFGIEPYEALLQNSDFNPGLSNATVNAMFGTLRKTLPDLIKKVTARQARETKPTPLPPVPVAVQKRISQRVMNAMGLDELHARLDESAHPFSSGNWNDLRLTTRYQEDDMLHGVIAVIHEAGHALYSHALPREWKGQPVGNAQSMWVHESQSLFWEKQIARSPEFMRFLIPIIRDELNGAGMKTDGPEWSADNIYRLTTRVKPDFIRTEADEVTYPAHVILRHDIEQKLTDGSLAVKDIPRVWNAGMKELLGVDVPDDRRGCLQDIHWSDGSVGYFPAYTFGALGAAQLMEALRGQMPEVNERIGKGDFAPIREWLVKNVHSLGSLYTGEELIQRATGKPLSIEPWLKHIETRYL